jgi:hypothetical protein
LLLFLDPGMDKNQDPGSGINIPDPQHWSLPLTERQGELCPVGGVWTERPVREGGAGADHQRRGGQRALQPGKDL